MQQPRYGPLLKFTPPEKNSPLLLNSASFKLSQHGQKQPDPLPVRQMTPNLIANIGSCFLMQCCEPRLHCLQIAWHSDLPNSQQNGPLPFAYRALSILQYVAPNSFKNTPATTQFRRPSDSNSQDQFSVIDLLLIAVIGQEKKQLKGNKDSF